MTPAGRPPRADKSSSKTITIRVTAEEHALLEQAAAPAYLSHWLREVALDAANAVPPSPEALDIGSDLLAAVTANVSSDKVEKVRPLLEPIVGHFQRLIRAHQEVVALKDAQIAMLERQLSGK